MMMFLSYFMIMIMMPVMIAFYKQIMIMNMTIGSYVDGWMNGNENDAHDSIK